MVDRDPRSLSVLLADLSRRFGHDFAVKGESSPRAIESAALGAAAA